MKYLSKIVLMLSCALFTANASYATDSDHSNIGDRCTYQSMIEYRQMRADENQYNNENLSNIPEEERPFATEEERISAGWLLNPTLTHPKAIHIAINISPKGDTIELEDGSIWSTSASDRSKTLDWMPADQILLTPNHSWFSSFDYRLTNQTTGSSVEANITLGPVLSNSNVHRIFAIDQGKGTITLYDGSVWDMSWFDRKVVSDWLVNDIVILGTNDGWWKSFNPNIIFNVSTVKHARASRTY